MKHLMLLIALFASATFQSFAQTGSDKVFAQRSNAFIYVYNISLDHRNAVRVEVTSVEALPRLNNIDSLLEMYLTDLAPLKDSIAGGLMSRRIDYLIMGDKLQKIRIRSTPPADKQFVSDNAVLALLKTEQDTIVITGSIPGAKFKDNNKPVEPLYRLTFYLNDLDDLKKYRGGVLQDKIKDLATDFHTTWRVNRDHVAYLAKHPEITSPGKYGGVANVPLLAYHLSGDLQNFKSYFVPSVTMGLQVWTTSETVHREFGLYFENHFLFAKDGTGLLKTYYNNFVTFSYGRSPVGKGAARYISAFSYVSVGYLVKRTGDFYPKGTVRLALTQVGLGEYIRVQPLLYFNGFFKKVTPGVKLVVPI